jgi:hypothetical protein
VLFLLTRNRLILGVRHQNKEAEIQMPSKNSFRALDGNRNPKYWWGALPCIPSGRDVASYKRLRHIWADQTRFRLDDGQRVSEFIVPRWETNITATLWENFTLFDSRTWVPALVAQSGLENLTEPVADCQWSYGWGTTGPPDKMADIIIHFRTEMNKQGIIIVEAKRPGGTLSEKDINPSYYLDIPELKAITGSRWLIYCVDQADLEKAKNSVDEEQVERCGFITWQDLGGLQIRLAKKLAIPEQYRDFIAGSIQYQYCQHDFRPSELVYDYLEEEPRIELMDSQAGNKEMVQGMWSRQLWRVDYNQSEG